MSLSKFVVENTHTDFARWVSAYADLAGVTLEEAVSYYKQCTRCQIYATFHKYACQRFLILSSNNHACGVKVLMADKAEALRYCVANGIIPLDF